MVPVSTVLSWGYNQRLLWPLTFSFPKCGSWSWRIPKLFPGFMFWNIKELPFLDTLSPSLTFPLSTDPRHGITNQLSYFYEVQWFLSQLRCSKSSRRQNLRHRRNAGTESWKPETRAVQVKNMAGASMDSVLGDEEWTRVLQTQSAGY